MMYHITKKSGSKNSLGIIAVVFFSALAYAVASHCITKHLVQYTDNRSTNRTLSVQLPDKTTILYLPVQSKLPIDTVSRTANKTQCTANINDIVFHQNPVFLVWTIIVCIMISLAAGSSLFFVSQIIELRNKFRLSRRKVWIGGVLYAVILDGFLLYSNFKTPGICQPPDIIDNFHILLDHGYVISYIVIITLIFILPGLSVMFLIATSSDTIYLDAKNDMVNDKKDNKSSIADAAKKLKYLHQSLQNALQLLSIIVILGVLSASSLGQSIKATIFVHGFDLYPKEISYVYGLYFTLFLCIVYIPVYAYLKRNYESLKELASEEVTDALSAEWYSKLFGDSKFEGQALQNVKLALTIIAPLLTSFLPNAFQL